MRAEPTGVIGRRVHRVPGPREEWEHFIRCDCGQRLDMRKLDEVLAHEEACPMNRLECGGTDDEE